jgi:hypothetical protein
MLFERDVGHRGRRDVSGTGDGDLIRIEATRSPCKKWVGYVQNVVHG